MVVDSPEEDLIVDVLNVSIEDIVMGEVEIAELQPPHGCHRRSQGKAATFAVLGGQRAPVCDCPDGGYRITATAASGCTGATIQKPTLGG
jgi:hypothetical protein